MSRTNFIGLAALGMLALSACSLVDGSAVRTQRQALDFSGVREVRVETFNGSVTVTSGSKRPTVTAEVRGEAEMSVAREGATLVVRGVKKNVWAMNRGVSFRLALPKDIVLNLESSNGDIEVTGPAKDVTAKTSNGSVDVRAAHGELRAETSNGRVTIEDVALAADSQNVVVSSNGSVRIRGLEAEGGLNVTGKTSNGSLVVNLPTFEVDTERHAFTAHKVGRGAATLNVETSNGSLDVGS
ncbi:DUF4097 family beta strand repeat-containing protein [Deinococcus yavapaiensis]|uniref:Putative adhesin n=1 Tax=Deinococcus yavapaiensis KR-236 TaxID=694435 RepID=A0A318S821_9DEIO|nr:DUF4097 family beta strand repeat-containing protein [Deinococcus yavapaiensis]PYE51171.1 putative adhesin [Deinococcus yavapaiensis KR-236]